MNDTILEEREELYDSREIKEVDLLMDGISESHDSAE
jgi:hypothetical protein